MKRRKFIKNASLSGLGITIGGSLKGCVETSSDEANVNKSKAQLPLVVATWNVQSATAKAWEVLTKGGKTSQSPKNLLKYVWVKVKVP